MIVSKLTSKARTTIPQPIRAALGLQPGDELSYEIVDGRVMLDRVQRGTATDDPFRAFEEWGSERIPAPMRTSERSDVIKLPFPQSDRATP